MAKDAAHNSLWRTTDVVFGLSLVLGLLLNYAWPLSLPILDESMLRHIIGAPLLLIGSLIVIFSKKELIQAGQPSEPKQPTTKIVKSGFYKYSRNPSYLGISLCFFGLSVALNMPWWLLLLLPTILITQIILIQPEEKYLEKTFGREFLSYKAAVRRWL